MSERLKGRVALVTGAASGIGAATARLMAQEGAFVVLADVDEHAGQALARELRDATFAYTDVSVEAQVAAAVGEALRLHGRLDCMVNNAGFVGAYGSILETSAAAWHATLGVLLDGVFYGIKHAARAMVGQASGCILSVASTAGVTGGLGPHAYTSAKHAVIGLTRSAASELAPHGVRVNAVAPGTTVTEMMVKGRGSREAAIDAATRASPLGTPLMPEEIAAALVYLASDDARHVNAHTLVVDSGVTVAGASGSAVFHNQPAGFMGRMPGGANADPG
ncbi:short-chain dehydrogenase [Burkholderia multivorans]|uniref:SDR family oxidoreductase n=1 Tax=Burkholderia multivorans TaxID=87883 RepID=UPI000D00AD43|nr:SDR family oxidoreductase [Burkholderia multivorans]PRE28517.1 short-chain dehydrogenase [Burkholderia multivorans]